MAKKKVVKKKPAKKKPTKKKSLENKHDVTKPWKQTETGRPEKLTREIQDQIVKAILVGSYVETAAAAAGLAKGAFYDWLKRGKREIERLKKPNKEPIEGEGKYVRFSNAINKAIGKAELTDVETIRKASKRNWKAAAWRLERKHSDKWGPKSRHEVVGDKGGPITTSVVFVKPDADSPDTK